MFTRCYQVLAGWPQDHFQATGDFSTFSSCVFRWTSPNKMWKLINEEISVSLLLFYYFVNNTDGSRMGIAIIYPCL